MDVPTRRRGREPPKPVPSTSTTNPSDQPEGWKLYRASNGLPFYFNGITGESIWARQSVLATTAEHPTRVRCDGVGDDVENPRPKQRIESSGSPRAPGAGTASSGARLRSSSFSSSSSSWSSSSLGENFKEDYESSTTTSDGSYRGSSSSSSDINPSGQCSSSESSIVESNTSSDDSWTGSMECRFRRLVRSAEGRKMLAEEVRVLTAQGVGRGHRRRRPTAEEANSSRQSRGTLIGGKGHNAGDGCGTDDVEVALLNGTAGVPPPTQEDGERSDNEASSSSSSGDSGLSLLSDDVVLRRLEGIGRTFIMARNAANNILRTSCGVASYVTEAFLEILRRWAARIRFSVDGAFLSASQ